MPILNFGKDENKVDEAQLLADEERLKKITADVNARNIKQQEKLAKLNKQHKAKRLLVALVALLTIGGLLTFGVYNTFIKEDLPISQIISAVNDKNLVTSFETDSVEGFLKQNINTIITEVARVGEGEAASKVDTWTVDTDSLYTTKIIQIDDSYANVYFNAKLKVKQQDYIDKETNSNVKGATLESYYSFVLPVYCFYEQGNWADRYYAPAGSLQLTPYTDANITNEQENKWLSFESIEQEPEDVVLSAKEFLQVFYNNLYNANQSVAQQTSAKNNINNQEVTYNTIQKLYIYKRTNLLGYNAYCEYVVETKEGVRVVNKQYLKLEQEGSTWKITKML